MDEIICPWAITPSPKCDMRTYLLTIDNMPAMASVKQGQIYISISGKQYKLDDLQISEDLRERIIAFFGG